MNDSVGSASRCLEICRAAGQAGKERQGGFGQRAEGLLPKRHMGSYGEDLTGSPLGLVLTSRVLFYCQLPVAPYKKKAEKRSAYTSKEGPRMVVAPQEQHLAPRPAARAWCPLPHGVCCCCPRCRHPPGETSGCPRRGGGEGNDRFLQLISAKQSHVGAEALVTVSGQDASLLLNKSSSTALEPSQGGRSHLIRPKQLTATLL